MCGIDGWWGAVFPLTVNDSISSLGTWSSVSEPKALDQSECYMPWEALARTPPCHGLKDKHFGPYK